MECELSEQAYQWQRPDGSWGVGKMVEHEPGPVLLGGEVQMSVLGKLEFVKTAMLIPYGPPGGEAMPQPASKAEAV